GRAPFAPYSHPPHHPPTRACGARMMLLQVTSPFLTAGIAPFQTAADTCPEKGFFVPIESESTYTL
ncbi:MAG TPA: hypothetical protein VGS22_25660, partial [Thermoanaerobaculia bacterium]|nr:hypothetical protein [Thermoanaerobaculia bacterium]